MWLNPKLKVTLTPDTEQNEYRLGVTVGYDVDFGIITSTRKGEASWTWTDSDTRSTSNGTNDTARVTVGGPSFGYTGPTDIAVYYDVLYKTFAFAPAPVFLSPTTGQVISRSGQSVSAGRW